MTTYFLCKRGDNYTEFYCGLNHWSFMAKDASEYRSIGQVMSAKVALESNGQSVWIMGYEEGYGLFTVKNDELDALYRELLPSFNGKPSPTNERTPVMKYYLLYKVFGALGEYYCAPHKWSCCSADAFKFNNLSYLKHTRKVLADAGISTSVIGYEEGRGLFILTNEELSEINGTFRSDNEGPVIKSQTFHTEEGLPIHSNQTTPRYTLCRKIKCFGTLYITDKYDWSTSVDDAKLFTDVNDLRNYRSELLEDNIVTVILKEIDDGFFEELEEKEEEEIIDPEYLTPQIKYSLVYSSCLNMPLYYASQEGFLYLFWTFDVDAATTWENIEEVERVRLALMAQNIYTSLKAFNT